MTLLSISHIIVTQVTHTGMLFWAELVYFMLEQVCNDVWYEVSKEADFKANFVRDIAL